MAFAEPVCHIVTPVGNLGYGFDNNGLQTLLRNLTTSTTPTVMIFNSFREENGHETKGMPVGLRASYLRDVQKLLRCVSSRRVPLIINVAPVEARGGHLDTIAEMVEETARSRYVQWRATGRDKTDNQASPQNLKVEKIEKCQLKSLPSPIDGSPEPERCITPRTIGGVVETFFEKIDATQDLDVLLSTSPSRLVPFMAFTSHCLKNLQLPSEQCSASAARVKGGVLHMAKLLEQGGVCCAPKCAGAVGTLYSDGSFEVAPVGAKSRCTSISVSSYILQSPSRLDVPELGGKLDLTQISYEQLEDCRSVRVQGSLILKAMESEQRMRERLERPYRAVYLGRITDGKT